LEFLLFQRMLVLVLISAMLASAGCARKTAAKSPAEALREAVVSQMGKGWAVVIGIEQYRGAAPVKFARADAEKVAALLAEQGFRVTALYDERATKAAIETALSETLGTRAGARDRVVVFFAGRTETRPAAGGKQGLLLPADAEPGGGAGTGIGTDRLRDLANGSVARHVLFLLAGNPGGVEGRAVNGETGPDPETARRLTEERGRQLIAFAGPDELPADVPEWGHGMFTHYLLGGLAQGWADINLDGLVPASELYAFLEPNIGMATRILGRHDRLQFLALSEEKGEFVFLLPDSGGTPGPMMPDTPGTQAVREAEREVRVLETRVRDLEYLEERGRQADEGGLSVRQQLTETRTLLRAARTRYLELRLQAGHEVIGRDGARMALVPAGMFAMGEDSTRYAVGDPIYVFAPLHRVYLDAFYIDKYEVTVARYAKFLEADKRTPPRFWNEANLDIHGDRPVIGVSWDDAASYCRWAGKRLPTEAEWEKASRGTDGRKYPWGNDEPREYNAIFDPYGVRTWQGYGSIPPVGTYEAGRSPYGVYDMAGSVWEWVADWHEGRYYLVSPKSNPKGPDKGKERVVRGGSWRHAPELMRSAYRHHYQPTVLPFTYLGFRCAQDVPK
jgi:formylglycine-generating enzyme required for sulfatase activity